MRGAVTPELESTALLYVRDSLATTERLERRVKKLERALARALDERVCDHVAEVAVLRAALAESDRRLRLAQPVVPTVYRVGRLTIFVDLNRVELGSRSVQVTPIEMRVLAILAARAERLVRCTDIERDVWGHGRRGNLLNTNICRLRVKLGGIGAADYLLTQWSGRRTGALRGISARCEREEAVS